MFAKPKGIALFTFDNNGKILDKKYNSLDDISRFIPINGKGKFDELGYLKPHNMLRTNSGKLLVISEGLDKRTVTDMVIMEFDDQNKISNSTIFPKEHHNIINRSEIIKSEESGELYKVFNYDYEFTSGESDNSTFFVVYRDYKEKKKKSYHTV